MLPSASLIRGKDFSFKYFDCIQKHRKYAFKYAKILYCNGSRMSFDLLKTKLYENLFF